MNIAIKMNNELLMEENDLEDNLKKTKVLKESHNPFTTKDDVEDTAFDRDTIINYIVGCKLGKTGQKFADVMAVKLMGF